MSEASFEPGVDPTRRTWIAITCGAGAVGGIAVAVPFVSTFSPVSYTHLDVYKRQDLLQDE